MSLKQYNSRLNVSSEITVGKTYHKSKISSFLFPRLLKIKILSHEGSVVTATIGEDTFIQTLTETEAFHYINAQTGHSDTP